MMHSSITGAMAAFRNAIEDRASYIEVYASDVRDPAQRKALEFVSGGGAKPGMTR